MLLFLPEEHPLVCESYALPPTTGEKERQKFPLPVAVKAFAHYVVSTNFPFYFESQGREVNMKGQSESITNPGLQVQGKVPEADRRSVASARSSFLFVLSDSFLHILTHFLFLFSPFPLTIV